MDLEIPVVKNYDPEKEVQETRSSLALALGQPELGLSEDQIQTISERLVNDGVRTKDIVKRISGTSFRKGQELAKASLEQEFKSKLDELSQEAGFAKKDDYPAQLTQRTAPDPEKVIGPDQVTTEITKMQMWFKGEMAKLKNERKADLEQARERLVSEKVKSTIAKLGFDDPESVLLLARKDAAFVFDPSDNDTLIAVKPGDRAQPLSGDGTYTTVDDYFAGFANTPLGMKFMKVPEGAKPGSGITGIASTPVQKGILSEENIEKAYRALGVG